MTKLTILLLTTAACFSQTTRPPATTFGHADIPPGNSFRIDTNTPQPTDDVYIQACAADVNLGKGGVQIYTPAPGVTYTFGTTTTIHSGYHTHETTIDRRPSATPAGSIVQTTSLDYVVGPYACTPPVEYQLPGVAGWYTFTATTSSKSPGIVPYPSLGFNMFAIEHEGTQTLRTFATYLEDLETVVPNNITGLGTHVDFDHFSGGFSKFVTSAVGTIIAGASIGYGARVANYPVQPINGNTWDVTRCSLPAGGITDRTDVGTFAPYATGLVPTSWFGREQEEHLWGRECDVTNPGLISPDRWTAFTDILSTYACRLGVRDPWGNAIGSTTADIDNWWSTADIVHIVCGVATARH